jgi:hypothetical protein
MARLYCITRIQNINTDHVFTQGQTTAYYVLPSLELPFFTYAVSFILSRTSESAKAHVYMYLCCGHSTIKRNVMLLQGIVEYHRCEPSCVPGLPVFSASLCLAYCNVVVTVLIRFEGLNNSRMVDRSIPVFRDI